MAGVADAQSWSPNGPWGCSSGPAPSQACARLGCDKPQSGNSKFCSLVCKESIEAEALVAKAVESSTLDLDLRDAQVTMREAAIEEREKAMRELEEAMRFVKEDLADQPSAPEVAQSTKRRPRRQGRGQLVAYVIRSPRKQSPRKSRSPTKARKSGYSLASTTDASSCNSPGRRSHRNRQSCSSCASTSRSMEEPPPARLTEQELLAPEAAKPVERPHFDAPAESLLGSFPLPLTITAWDWPLSRDEKKSLVLMFDRQELMVQRDEFAEKLMKVRGVLSGAA